MMKKLSLIGREKFSYCCSMVQAMIPKALRPMNFYFSTIYQEIWVGLALTTYTYYKISYGGKKGSGNKSSGSGHH